MKFEYATTTAEDDIRNPMKPDPVPPVSGDNWFMSGSQYVPMWDGRRLFVWFWYRTILDPGDAQT